MDILGLIALARSKGGGSGSGTFVPSFGTLATISTGVSWFGDDPYTLTVLVNGYTVTDKTMISVLPSANVIEQMMADGVTNIFITNNNGVLTATTVGGAPTAAMTLQVLCSESDVSENIAGLPAIVGDGIFDTLEANNLTDAVNQLSNAIDEKAPVIINTASGDIDSFADGADGMQIRKIVGTIVTPEGGSGWAGCEIGRCVSLLNGFTPDYRVGWAVSADSGDMNPYGGIGTACADYIDVSNYLGKQVYLNHRPTGNVGGFAFYSAKNISSYITGIGNRGVTTQGEWIITIPDNPSIKYMRFTANTNYLDKVILCLVETKTTLSINWQSEAGTILNGTVTLNEDRSADIVNSDTEDTYHLADVGSLSTFYGYNNIWIDTGSITECDYPADTKLYIDGLTAPDEDMIANANIASGKYFVVNNQLYLSTAAIAAGASIVPGTNCTATNLAEALNALNT